jgi:hypothetical protein
VRMIEVDFTTQPDRDHSALKALYTRFVLEKNGFQVSGVRFPDWPTPALKPLARDTGP